MSGANTGFLGWLADTRGNVLPLAAMAMLLSAALVGGGIDMSRAYRVENRLQSACDASVLAGRRAVTSEGYTPTAQTQTRTYFSTNFDDTQLGTRATVFTPSTDDDGATIKGTATTKLDMAVMKLFGFKEFNLSVACEATMGVGNSDVTMVLDTTGSMGSKLGSGTRISALQDAMKNFYSTVKTATAGSNARVRYGFVPYSTSVNVGRLLYDLDPSYLVDNYNIQSRQPLVTYPSPDTSDFVDGSLQVYSTTPYNTTAACEAAKPANTAWANNGSPTSTTTTSSPNNVPTSLRTDKQPQKRRAYQCYAYQGKYYHVYSDQTQNYNTYTKTTMQYRQVNYDVSAYKAFTTVTTPTGSYGALVSSTWEGCIEERASVSASAFAYTTLGGISPSGARDLDLDSAPTSNATKWAPMWPQVAYIRLNSGGNLTNNATSDYGAATGSYCPVRAQLLTEMSKTQFDAYAMSLKATGSTYLDIGMIWGGRLSSPDGIFKDNVGAPPSNGGEVSRHVIFMTDGIMEPNYTIQQAWGIEWHDRRVTDDGYSNDASRHTSRFLAVCEAIKAKGIRVWAIAFTSGVSSDLSTCASPDSSFTADSATELNEAFQEIAKQVGELRLTQ